MALRFRRGNNDVLLQKSPPSGYHARTYLTTPFATLLAYSYWYINLLTAAKYGFAHHLLIQITEMDD
jgi:hypothetical protein